MAEAAAAVLMIDANLAHAAAARAAGAAVDGDFTAVHQVVPTTTDGDGLLRGVLGKRAASSQKQRKDDTSHTNSIVTVRCADC